MQAARLAPSAAAVKAVLSAMDMKRSWKKASINKKEKDGGGGGEVKN